MQRLAQSGKSTWEARAQIPASSSKPPVPHGSSTAHWRALRKSEGAFLVPYWGVLGISRRPLGNTRMNTKKSDQYPTVNLIKGKAAMSAFVSKLDSYK